MTDTPKSQNEDLQKKHPSGYVLVTPNGMDVTLIYDLSDYTYAFSEGRFNISELNSRRTIWFFNPSVVEIWNGR